MAGSREAGPTVATILVRTLPNGSSIEFDMEAFTNKDSQDPRSVHRAAPRHQGRIILNSLD